MPNPRRPSPGGNTRNTWLWQTFILLFCLLGVTLRLYKIDSPPLEFHPTRQLHSAILARGFYYHLNPALDPTGREFVLAQAAIEGIIEPPILEGLSALAYQLAGGEILWFPRVLVGLGWLAALLPLILLLRRWSGWPAAAAGTAFWLFSAYAVPASRSFQPDALMTAFLLWTLWALDRWMEAPLQRSLVPAGILGGLAVLLKTTAIFPLAAAFAALILLHPQRSRLLRLRGLWIFAALLVVPSLLFYLYGSFIAGFSRGQFSMRVFPSLWLDPAFYLRWLRKVQLSLGIPAIVLGLLGDLTVPQRDRLRLLAGWFAGYLLYCLILGHHISTHDYYHVMLYPLAALGLGLLFGLVQAHLAASRPVLPVLAGLLLLGWSLFAAYDAWSILRKQDTASEAARLRQLGKDLAGKSVVGLFPDYAYALRYYGRISPQIWPEAGDIAYQSLGGQSESFEELFLRKTEGMEWFAIGDLEAFHAQPALVERLENRYPQLSRDPALLLFDLAHPLPR